MEELLFVSSARSMHTFKLVMVYNTPSFLPLAFFLTSLVIFQLLQSNTMYLSTSIFSIRAIFSIIWKWVWLHSILSYIHLMSHYLHVSFSHNISNGSSSARCTFPKSPKMQSSIIQQHRHHVISFDIGPSKMKQQPKFEFEGWTSGDGTQELTLET